MPNFHLSVGGGWVRTRPERGNVVRISRPARLLCILAVSFASIAALAPAAATATTNAKLFTEAKAAMKIETRAEEKLHIIPYKQSAVFTVSCSRSRDHITCREHTGPTKCARRKPLTVLSDIFPIIKGRVGLSLLGALVVSSVYC